MTLHSFQEALQQLGRNDEERAAILGVSPRSITRYKAGKLPKPLAALMRKPSLLRALASDADKSDASRSRGEG